MLKTIEIHQPEIDVGIPGDAEKCPVSLAVREVVAPRIVVVTGIDSVWFSDGKNHLGRSKLSKRAQSFVAEFDDEKPTKPLRFRIDIPEDVPLREDPGP